MIALLLYFWFWLGGIIAFAACLFLGSIFSAVRNPFRPSNFDVQCSLFDVRFLPGQ